MALRPQVRYAKSEDLNIAYQVVEGNGPDLIYVSGWVSHLDMMWEDPFMGRFAERLAEFSRLIVFDKRGVGLSDRVSLDRLPTLEQRMDDVRAVLDAAGSSKAFLFGHSEGSVMSALFAATYPDRTEGLVLYGGYAARSPSPDYPWAPSPESRSEFFQQILDDWPSVAGIQQMAPSMETNDRFIEGMVRYLRSAASPAAAHALAVMNTEADVRNILETITVPTLLLHRTGDPDAAIEGARYMAEKIPGARMVELDGHDHLPWTEDPDSILTEIEEFVTGVRPVGRVERVLATVLFTDIVDSTGVAVDLGDAAWHRTLDEHDALCIQEIERFRGRPIKNTGDGFLATFDGPARAIRCAQSIADRVTTLGLEIRAGLHTGEIELRGADIGGVAVHFAARVIGFAGSSEVVVSRTVKDLVAGSGIEFSSRGQHALKGIPGEWELFAVSAERP